MYELLDNLKAANSLLLFTISGIEEHMKSDVPDADAITSALLQVFERYSEIYQSAAAKA